MEDFDEIAEKLQTADGLQLVDYLPIAVPVYLVHVDSLVSEKRKLLPTEEFLIRGVRAGATSKADVLGVLGLSGLYGERLLATLAADELVTEHEPLQIRPRGEALLLEGGEFAFREKQLRLAWDPIGERVLLDRLPLLKSATVKKERLVKAIPHSVRIPPAPDLPLDGVPTGSERETVVRHLEVRRRTLMYRRALLLLYANTKNAAPVARIAIDGVVDPAYSEAFARHQMLPRLGVDSQFTRRLGAIAVPQRIRPLGDSSSGQSLDELLRKRSLLQLGVASLQRNSDERSGERLTAKKVQLEEVEQRLNAFPIREILPFEMPQLIDNALQRARREILITTTVPIAARLSAIRVVLLEQALKRGVSVRLLISDRPAADDLAADDSSALRRLSRLMERFRNLEVAFLKETERVVFEVLADELFVAVANDPPLGSRGTEGLARVFVGHLLTGKRLVGAYRTQFLESLPTVGKFRFAHQPPVGASRSGRGRASSP